LSEALHAPQLSAVPGCREVQRATSGGQVPIPRWVTALDVLCLVVVGLMLRAMVDDGYRITLAPGIQMSLRSWPRLGFWLAILLAVRHAAWRLVGWPSRVSCWAWTAVRWIPGRAVWPAYVVSRLMVLGAAYAAVNTVGFSDGRPFRALQNDVLDLFARWDAGWYFGIASNGYESHFNPERMNAIAFFPGLPLAMRIIGVVLDVDLWAAGIIVVTIAFFLGLTYVYRLALDEGLPDAQARASVMFLAFYPFAVCYSAILTEALFLLAAGATFFYFRRGVGERDGRTTALWQAGVCGVFVGLLRPNGFLLSIPLGLMALMPFARSRGWLTGERPVHEPGWVRLAVQLAVAALPVAGMIAYAAHANAVVGRPFAFVEAQAAWGRESFGGLATLEARWDMIHSQGFAAYARMYTIEMVEAAAAFFALAAVWPITRRFGVAYGVFVAMAVLPPLVTMGSVSLGRYTAPLFPIFLWLGAAVPERHRPYWLAVFAAGQALVAVLFFTWRPPY
jgi:hypothetical protein